MGLFLAKIGAWFAGKAIILSAAAAIFLTYTVYIDRKATYRERGKWEEKVRVAKIAAEKQDKVAEERATKAAKVTIDYLSQQKAIDDAAIAKLQADLKSRKIAKSCIVDKFDAYQLRN